MVEPITSVPSHVTTLHQLAAASVDVLAHYFVLEHVRDTDGFHSAARRALAPGALMICEVPDLHLYPQESSALLLHEHVSHFSPESLSALAARYGFAAVEISHRDCSRPFAFAGVFSLAPPSTARLSLDPARALLRRGSRAEHRAVPDVPSTCQGKAFNSLRYSSRLGRQPDHGRPRAPGFLPDARERSACRLRSREGHHAPPCCVLAGRRRDRFSRAPRDLHPQPTQRPSSVWPACTSAGCSYCTRQALRQQITAPVSTAERRFVTVTDPRRTPTAASRTCADRGELTAQRSDASQERAPRPRPAPQSSECSQCSKRAGTGGRPTTSGRRHGRPARGRTGAQARHGAHRGRRA